MDTHRLNRILIEAAGKSDLVQSSRHAAAILLKGQILAIGNNRRKSHPIMAKYDKENTKRIFLHAEVDAIIKTINLHGIEILSDVTLYVIRVTKGGNLGNSAPCIICQRVIKAMGIPQVFWSV